jgi:hypothetical protein
MISKRRRNMPIADKTNLSQEEIFSNRRTRKKKGHSKDDVRIVRLRPIPDRVWVTKRVVVRAEDIDSDTLGICRPCDEIVPGFPGYQREEITSEVGDLADVLRRGGATEPIHAVSRAWETKYGKQKIWIVDGQQRMWASIDANCDLTVMVHSVESPEEERGLFEAMNSRVKLNANLRVFNHGGAASKLLIADNEDQASPLFQRIAFGTCRHTKISATTLVVALGIVSGSTSQQAMKLLPNLDRRLEKGSEPFKSFLRAVGLVFFLPPPGIAFGSPQVTAFANAWRRSGVRAVDARLITRLRRVGARLPDVVASTYQERIELMTRRLMKILKPEQMVA